MEQGSQPLVPMLVAIISCISYLSGQKSSLQAAPKISTVVYSLCVMAWKMASLVAVKDSNNLDNLSEWVFPLKKTAFLSNMF